MVKRRWIAASCALSNDNSAVIEHRADKLWDSRIDRSAGPLPWSATGATGRPLSANLLLLRTKRFSKAETCDGHQP
jgi:hypothetical protein